MKYIEGDGKNDDTTENLYIEGENLEVLKLLQNSYYGKIKPEVAFSWVNSWSKFTEDVKKRKYSMSMLNR